MMSTHYRSFAVLIGLCLLISFPSFSQSASLLKDTHPGADHGGGDEFRSVGDNWMFQVPTEFNGRELWVTDGTDAGTTVLVDSLELRFFGWLDKIKLTDEWSAIGNGQFFAAELPETGIELFFTDGTREGTQLVKDIQPGFSGSNIGNSGLEFNGRLYFTADDGEHGLEPWVTDGTAEGTKMLVDLVPGDFGSTPRWEHAFYHDGWFYVPAFDENKIRQLWRFDPVTKQTEKLSDISSQQFQGVSSIWSEVLNDRFIFTVSKEDVTSLWSCDLTTGDVGLLIELNKNTNAWFDGEPGRFFDGHYIFPAHDATHGRELWRTDGTPEGTQLVADLNPGNSLGVDLFHSYSFELGGALFFVGLDGVHGMEIFQLTSALATPQLFVDLDTNGSGIYSGNAPFLNMGDYVLFMGSDQPSDQQIWRTDGTQAGTYPIQGETFDPNWNRVSSNQFYRLGNKAYFMANHYQYGVEPWVTDGTQAGTQLLLDTYPGSNSGIVTSRRMEVVGNRLFFNADTPDYGYEPYTVEGWSLTTGIHPVDHLEKVALPYPNPTNGLLHLPQEWTDEAGSLEVINALGQTVRSVPQSRFNSVLDMSPLPEGHYFLRFSTEEEVHIARIVKL